MSNPVHIDALLALTGYQVSFEVDPIAAKLLAELLPVLFAKSTDMEASIVGQVVTLQRKHQPQPQENQ